MQHVEKSMGNGWNENRSGSQKDDATEQRIKGGENFTTRRGEHISRAHACENHWGIVKTVYPRKLGEVMVSKDTDG